MSSTLRFWLIFRFASIPEIAISIPATERVRPLMKSAANAGLLCIMLSLPHAAAEPDLAGHFVPAISEERKGRGARLQQGRNSFAPRSGLRVFLKRKPSLPHLKRKPSLH